MPDSFFQLFTVQFFFENKLILYVLAILGVLSFWEFLANRGEKQKKFAVIFFGASLLGWLDFASLVLLTCLSFCVYLIAKYKVPVSKVLYPLVLIFIVILVCIKEQTFFAHNGNPIVPLGVSYYFFRLISFVIEYSNNKPKYQNVPLLDFYAWVFFFPTFLAGPILRFHEFSLISQEQVSRDKLKFYVRFLGALFLKFLVVDYLLYSLAYTVLLPNLQAGMQYAPFFLCGFGVLAFLHAYFDLMLYTEMSKALAGYLGFTNVDNFNRPLLATNVSQFWQRWHMSLSNWTRDYVFFPALVKTRKFWLASYASMMTIGIWHSISFNWLIWAFCHGTALVFYSWLRARKVFKWIAVRPKGRKLLSILGNVCTLMFVSQVFIFVAFHDIKTPLLLFDSVFDVTFFSGISSYFEM